MAEGPAAALALLDDIVAAGELEQYHLLHSSRAHFLQQLGRLDDAAQAYRTALALATNDVERTFLRSRLSDVEALR